ncbi:hypothetical protein J2X71_004189 [Rhizobium sp. 1399]|nr:hypothetical protein [Rhizobium sp. 1399]
MNRPRFGSPGLLAAARCLAFAKSPRELFEGSLKFGLFDLDLAKSCFQCDTADTFGFTRFGKPQLFLQLGNLLTDPGGWLLHSGSSFHAVSNAIGMTVP